MTGFSFAGLPVAALLPLLLLPLLASLPPAPAAAPAQTASRCCDIHITFTCVPWPHVPAPAAAPTLPSTAVLSLLPTPSRPLCLSSWR